MFHDKKDIKSINEDEIKNDIIELGKPKYVASQIFQWLSKGTNVFNEMSNISSELKNILSEKYYISYVEVIQKLVSKIDGTTKYLFKLRDGNVVESVVMKYKHGYSICISTQVGCKMNCSFCATGKQGFKRNLLPGEMISQIQEAQKDLNIHISNVVLMGMGEPLDNYNNTVKFLELISCSNGMNIGMRHISLSTCGIVDKIYELAKLKLQLTLSISLHAPDNKLRSDLMPINKKYGLYDLIDSCKYYSKETGRRISFEYAMIDNVNDNKLCVKNLGNLLKGMLCHVNLIPVNKVKGAKYQRSSKDNINMFIDELKKYGIVATKRRTLGSDIEASCGQLKQRYCKKESV